jgi:hypothetical protein
MAIYTNFVTGSRPQDELLEIPSIDRPANIVGYFPNL